jgi:hypothetical protein
MTPAAVATSSGIPTNAAAETPIPLVLVAVLVVAALAQWVLLGGERTIE